MRKTKRLQRKMWFNQTLLSLFRFISTIFINQGHEIILKKLKTFILSGTRTQTLELHISHTTWTQTHHLDTTCCSYLSDKILFIIYSSPCVMRFVSKVSNFYSVRQMYDKIWICYEILYAMYDNNTDSFIGEGSKLLCY